MIFAPTEKENEHAANLASGYYEKLLTLEEQKKATTDEKELYNLLTQEEAIASAYMEELDKFLEKVQAKRFAPIKKAGTDAILKHAKEQIPLILDHIKAQFIDVVNMPLANDLLKKEQLQALGNGCIKYGKIFLYCDFVEDYINNELKLHIASLTGNALEELNADITTAANSWQYSTKRTGNKAGNSKAKHLSPLASNAIFKANMPIYHGKPTDMLASLSNTDIVINKLANTGIIKTDNGTYKIENLSQQGNLGINTHKLLMVAIAEFTQNNNYGTGGKTDTCVSIPFYDYARYMGYEIDERKTNSPEEAEKEAKRAREAVKTAKKRIKQDLELLQAMRLTWHEKVKGKAADFDSVMLFERVAIKQGRIIIGFGNNMAEYLRKLPEAQYPRALLSISARQPNAYRIGFKMAEHYNNDNNHRRGTCKRLKVSSLLSVTDLPTIEDLRNETEKKTGKKKDNSRQWATRIKKPLEDALEVLTGKVISDWKYTKAKGEELTGQEEPSTDNINELIDLYDSEIYNLDYDTFINLYVEFELIDAPDHTDRLKRRAAEAKEAAKEKKKAGKGKKKAYKKKV